MADIMRFLPYTCSEILDYFDQINCIDDVFVIGDYLNDNKDDYSMSEYEMMRRLLYVYIDLFV